MTKVLDFLVENYIYVAGISGFFIVVLIGFLYKDKEKKKKGESVIETSKVVESVDNIQVEETSEAQQTEIPEKLENAFETASQVVEADSVLSEEQSTVPQVEFPKVPTIPIVDFNNAIPAQESFEVVLDRKPTEILDFGEHIILDKERLDYEVDIIDFPNLKNEKMDEDVVKSTKDG